MLISIGAIAYRASRSNEVEERIRAWQMTHDSNGGGGLEYVSCPKCGERYILVEVEGIDATKEIMQDDMEFLAKALSTVHPSHPTRMVIRDPDGVLYRRFHPQSAATRGNVKEEAFFCELPALP